MNAIKRCVNSMAKRQGNINSFSNVFDFDNAFRSYLSPLTCAGIDVDLMPDFGVEGIEVNGIRFSSEGFFYFGAIGFDYGCGFMVSLVKDIPDFTNLSLLRNKSAVSISLNSSLNNKEFFKQQFSSSIPFFSDSFTQLQKDGQLTLGEIEQGNHFIEIKRVGEICDGHICKLLDIEQGDYFIVIHNGTTKNNKKKVIKEFLHKCASIHNVGETNIYSVKDKLTYKHLAEYFEMQEQASINRILITKILSDNLEMRIRWSFDSCHDFIERIKNKVYFNKGCQKYKRINGVDIAFVTSDLKKRTSLVCRTGNYPYLNHGTPLKSVESEKRVYCDIDEVESIWKKHNMCKPVAFLDPLLSIKNSGRNYYEVL